MAIFGRRRERKRIQQAARQSLTVPPIAMPVDCTPYVLVGLWPHELSVVTAQTAPIAEYLRSDLQRIVNTANEKLRAISQSGLAEFERRSEETRAINVARAFAILRVESTVRNLRKEAIAYQEYLSLNSGGFVGQTQGAPVSPPPNNAVPEPSEFASAQEHQPDGIRIDENHPPLPIVDPVTRNEQIVIDVAPEPTPAPPPPPPSPPPLDATPTQPPAQEPRRHEMPRASTAPTVQQPLVAEVPHSEPAHPQGRTPPPPSAEEPAKDRLLRIVEAVARQEPGLRWAAGLRDDGSTVLVTDLAHGWVPSGVALPEGVHLLPPGRRTGGVASFLGAVRETAKYQPGDPFGPNGTRPPRMSDQSRQVPEIADLGWELGEATHWRDGLPRLANTLAKAAAARTGVVEAEVELLRVYLDTARYQLLAQYPTVDQALLLNCLLLAATEGLANQNPILANYHYSWFRELSAPIATSRWSTAAGE